MEVSLCPVCAVAGVSTSYPGGDNLAVHCPRCRHYVITGTAARMLDDRPTRDRHLLSGRIRRHWTETERPLKVTSDMLDTLQDGALRSVLAKQEALLFDIAKQSRFPGAVVNVGPLDAVIVDAEPGDELYFHLKSLVDRRLLLPTQTYSELVVSAQGWEHVEQRQNPTTGNRTDFFVAMSFSDALVAAWERGIRPAVADAGYVAKRVDSDPHNDKIDDRIIAGIRRSFAVIADMTEQKGGTYFEAGFALGLNRPVVWTVREDEIDKVHFDTRQFAHILWKNEDDLREKLTTHLVAVFGQGPLT